MKEQYIKQVKKELNLSGNAKREILRDLQEIFASALEHGETEQQVMARLGSPKEFAKNAKEPFEEIKQRPKRGKIVRLVCCALGAVIFFGLFFSARLHQVPDNVIGQANSMTGILVSSPLPFNISWFLGIAGCVFLILTIIFAVKLVRR